MALILDGRAVTPLPRVFGRLAVWLAGLFKTALMWAYGRGLLSFDMTERIASWLRRYRWFREG